MSYKIQEIFLSIQRRRLPGQSYHPAKAKVFNAICSCRTSQMGGFIRHCDDCGRTETRFHSCRNRHCPICQGSKQAQWVQKQASHTLPVPYFHVVFTLPSELNSLILTNPRQLYSLLFQAASETILTLSKDPKFLGAQAGFTTILHTWGSNLQFHPHLHCIVAGGGLSIDQKSFIRSKDNFFLPVRAMKKIFRGKFLERLKQLFCNQKIKIPKELKNPKQWYSLLDQLYKSDWIVYCKKPFKNSAHVLRYLGRYTHRVAISDSRIISYNPESGLIRFKWKDYRNKGIWKVMELSDQEFVRRFLLHVLPDGLIKIRHYGFLANNGRERRLDICREFLQVKKSAVKCAFPLKESELLKANSCCPSCGSQSFNVSFSSPRYQPAFLLTGTGP